LTAVWGKNAQGLQKDVVEFNTGFVF